MSRDHNHYRNDSSSYRTSNSHRSFKHRDGIDNNSRKEYPKNSRNFKYRNVSLRNSKYSNRWVNQNFQDDYYGRDNFRNQGYNPSYQKQRQQNYFRGRYDSFPQLNAPRQFENHRNPFLIEQDRRDEQDNEPLFGEFTENNTSESENNSNKRLTKENNFLPGKQAAAKNPSAKTKNATPQSFKPGVAAKLKEPLLVSHDSYSFYQINEAPSEIQDSDTSSIDIGVQKPGLGPSISLVPLSFLIDPKLQNTEKDQQSEPPNDTVSSAEIEQNQIGQRLQPEKSTFKKPELISKKLINKVATMDKSNIRNVINNPILKFDVALKMHAKKRLREEIRKQLRSMSFDNRQTVEESILHPDGYVDPENIPHEVLRQFESVFKMEFECGPENIVCPVSMEESNFSPVASTVQKNVSNVCAKSASAPSPEVNANGSEVSLRTRFLHLEMIKEQVALEKSQQQSIESDDDVCIVEPTKESNSRIPYDESSTDSSATNTTCTSSGSLNVPQRKLEEKFLECFKREILPNLPQNARKEYENSSGKDSKISKIYSMCLEKLQSVERENNSSEIQFNGSSSDEALNFLIQKVRELFAAGKSQLNQLENNEENSANPTIKPSKPAKKLNHNNMSNNANRKTKCNSNAAISQRKKPAVKGIKNVPKKSFELSVPEVTEEPSNKIDVKHSAMQAKKAPKKRPLKRKASCKTTNEKNAKIRKLSESHLNNQLGLWESSKEISLTGNNQNSVASKKVIGTNPILADLLSQGHNQTTTQNFAADVFPLASIKRIEKETEDTISSTNDSKVIFNERLWRSPGEKKCLEPPTDSQIHKTRIACTSDIDENDETIVDSANNQKNSKGDADDELVIEAKETEDKIRLNGNNTLEALKTLDTSLIDLNQKKMDIEKNIIELQKEKMEIDLKVMQLQNERFALISSVVSNQNECLTTNSNLHNLLSNSGSVGISNARSFGNGQRKVGKAKKKTPAKSIMDPKKKAEFLEKLKNRKKRCNRDILIEYSASTFFPDSSKEHYEEIRDSNPAEITEKVSTMFAMPTRRSQRPVQVVTPEKPKNEKPIRSTKQSPPSISSTYKASSPTLSRNLPTENLLPMPCVGQFVNITESDNSDCDGEDNDSGHFSDSTPNSNRQVTNGHLTGFRLPIVKMIGVEEHILCASEDGNIYKFDSVTRKLVSTFSKHTESITEMCVDGHGCVYSTSLDGYMKKTSLENFGLELQSVNLHEPLQAVNLCWNTAFLGSRWGNVFTYDTKKNKLNDSLLCSVGSAIIAIKATKEGPRRIIIISSRGETIHFRDANSGLLLRTARVRENENISNIALNGGLLYCGSFSNKVFIYDFTTGNEINSYYCGNGAVSLKIYMNKLIFIGCYDGFIYVLDKETGEQIGRFPGAGKMILALEIIGEKVLTSSKEGLVQIIDIPRYVLTRLK